MRRQSAGQLDVRRYDDGSPLAHTVCLTFRNGNEQLLALKVAAAIMMSTFERHSVAPREAFAAVHGWAGTGRRCHTYSS